MSRKIAGMGRRSALVSSILALSPIILPWAALAQTVPVGPGPGPNSSSTSPGSSTLARSLDLGSTRASVNAAFSSPVNITVGGTLNNGTIAGGTQMTISPGQVVTPAHYAAAAQIFNGGNQSLVVNTLGAAQSGNLNLSSKYVQNLSNIVVPSGVSLTAIGYNAASPLNVTGALNIMGSVYALQTASNISSVLNLGSLTVNPGGLLSAHLPSGTSVLSAVSSSGMKINVAGSVLNLGTITTPGNLSIIAGGDIVNQSPVNASAVMSAQNINLFTGGGNIINSGLVQAINTYNLPAASTTTAAAPSFAILDAAGDITNTGMISSAGSLRLTAGGSIVNALAEAKNGASPAIEAGANVDLSSGTGNITNSGLISSSNSDINIAASTMQTDINVNAAGGTFQAPNGNINLRDASYDGFAGINLNGGDYLSRELNLYTGKGTATVNVGQVDGNLNTVAGAEHVFADTSLLKLGEHCISGDPTYYNTGGIEIVGTVSSNENLAIIAGGDITADVGGQIVTNGYKLLMIAGANITSSCTGCTSPGPGEVGPSSGTVTPTSGLASGTVDVSLTGGTGGSIDLSKSTAPTAIDTSSTSDAGGDVMLVALADPSGAKGQVLLNTGSKLGEINTTGAGAGGGGDVTIYAGASSLLPIESISTNQIKTTSNGTLNSGSVTLETTQAVTSDGKVLVLNAAGSISSPNSIQPGAAAMAGISTGNIFTVVNGGSQAGGDVSIKAYGDIDTSAGTIATINNGVGAAGEVTITSSNGSVSTGEIDSFVYSGWLAAANVTISAFGDITTNGNFIYAFQGGSGAGGTITLTSSNGSVSTGMLLTGVGDTVAAGNVIVSAKGNIITGDVLAFNVGTGGGGTVNLTSSNGGILTGEIATNTLLGLVPAGNVSLSAFGDITVVGGIDASNAGISTGGSVTLLTLGSVTTGTIDTSTKGSLGGSITVAAAGNNSSYSIALGDLKTSGTAAAGFVEIVSTDLLEMPSLVGTITAQASGPSGVGGAIGIATRGALAVGNIDTTNTAALASGAAQSGSVFLSSGSTAAGAILAGDIKAFNSNGSATGQVILIASGTIGVLGTITTSPGNSSVNPSYTSLTSSISSSTTIDVSVTGISGLFSNYNPQGYLFMSGGSTQITIDSGGNSSLLAPLLCLSTVSIDSIKSNSGTQADGVALVALGDITLGGTVGASTVGSTSGGNISLLSIAGKITVDGLATSSSGAGAAGNVSATASGLVDIGGTINASNTGTGSGGTVTLTSSTNSVSVAEIGTFAGGASAAAGSVFVSAYGDVNTNNNAINTYNGYTGPGGTGSGGTVFLVSSTGPVATGKIETYVSDSSGVAGNVVIAAFGDIDTNSNAIAAYNGGTGASGNVILISSNGSITTSAIDTSVAGGSEKAADVTVSAYGDISLTGTLNAANTGSGSGSTINLLTGTGSVTTGGINVDVSSSSIVAGNVNIEASGAIDTSAGTIQARNGGTRPIDGGVILLSHTSSVKTGAIDISVTAGSALAGDVTISAFDLISVGGAINSSNAGTGDGGKVTLGSSNKSITLTSIDTHVESAAATAGTVSISALDLVNASGAINTSNSGSGISGGGAAGTVIILSGSGSVSTGAINANVGGGSATGGTVTILADGFIKANGTIDTSNSGTGAGAVVALTSATGSVTTKGILTGGGGSAPSGNLVISGPLSITTENLASNNTGSGAGGSLALISSGEITTGSIISSGTPSGSVFLSSGASGLATVKIKTGAITLDGGALLATAATSGSVTVQSFTDGSTLSVDAGQIFATGKYTSAVNILPASFSNSSTSTITPAAIPGGGFKTFSNSGTVTLANDAGSSGNVITFANLLPVYVQDDVSSLGTLNDSTGRANFFVYTPAVKVSSSTEYSSATGSLSILANKIELAAVHTTGVDLNLTAVQNISASTINTVNSFGTMAGNVALLSLTGSVSTGAIETYVSSGLASAGNVTVSAYGAMTTNGQTINASNSGSGAGGTVNITTSGSGSVEIGHIETKINNASSSAAAGNITILAAAALDTNGQTIDASNSGTGAGGNLTLTSKTFSIKTADIDTHVASGSAPAGNVFISSLQLIDAGNINTSHSGTGTGGSVTFVRAAAMIAKDIDTSSTGSAGGSIIAGAVGDNGDITLQMGDLNTSGFTSAGSVMLIGDDFGVKPLKVGDITAQATGPNGVGGSVGISGLGTVEVGNIDTSNTAAIASTGAQSGSVFLSSGKNPGILGPSILSGGINAYNSKNGSSTGQVILIGSGSILTLGAITTSAGSIPANLFISKVLSGTEASITPNYTSDKLSITSSTTIDVSVTGISASSSNYNPSGYAALSGNNTVLTIDSGGNSLLLAPLVFTAYVPMVIKSINSSSHTAADSIALLVFGNLTLSDPVGINASGSSSGGLVTLQSSAGQISVSSIDTSSGGSGAAGNINISTWSAIPVTGKINASNSGSGAGGSVFLASTTNSVLTGDIDTYASKGSAAAGNIIISSYGSMSTGKLNASNSGTGAGGLVFLNSSNGSVTTGDIDTYATGAASAGGSVFISAYGSVNTDGSSIRTYSSAGTGSGGAVSLSSASNSASVVVGKISTYLGSGSGSAGNLTITSLGPISLESDVSAGTIALSAGQSITILPGVSVSNTVSDLLINTNQLINQGSISSSGNIWVFTPTGSDLTVDGTGTMSASATVFGLSPAGGGTVTNQNLFITGKQTVTGDLGLFSSATGFPGVVSLSAGSSLSSSTGINIDTPTLINAGTLTADGTFSISGVTPNPGPIGIFAQNQRASAGISISGDGGTWNALAGGTYIQALYPNGIVLSGSQTFNGALTLNDVGGDGVTIDPGVVITVNGPAALNTKAAVINGKINLNAGGVVSSTGDISGSGLITASSGTLTLISTAGNIGSSLTPLAVSSGASGVKNLNLNVLATAGTPGNGNVWLTDSDADPGLVGNPAVFLNAEAGSTEGLSSSGNFTMTATAGSIGIHPTRVLASNSVTLIAQRSIIQKHGETITAPIISLTAVDGNVGLSATSPTLVSSGSSGKTQLQLTANAKANTSGNGNIWISDADLDINWGVPVPAVLLGASAAGTGVPVDGTTGNFQLTTTAGGIAIGGAVSASNVITFISNNSILQSTGGSLSGPNINLKSTTGNLGSSSNPILVSSGGSGSKQLNLNVVASANTVENGNIWLTDSDLDVGPLAPAVLLFGIAGSGSAALNSGTFTMTNTGGSIGIHPTILTASRQITLTAQENIVQLHGEVVSAPIISLTAVTGNIGLPAIPYIVSGGASGSTQLQLTLSAPNNASGRGNIFITNPDADLISGAPAVMLGAATAGSGSPVDATTGRFVFSTSAGSIGFNGASNATTSLSFDSRANIIQASGGSLNSPSMSFTASTGNIGSSPLPISSNAKTLSANAFGNVYLSASNSSLTLAASSGNVFVLTTTGSNAVTTISGINANNITLQSQTASNGSFAIDGSIGGQLSTDADNVTISAGGSGDISNPNGNCSINANTLSLSSGSGTIGINSAPIVTKVGTLTAKTSASGATEGVFIFDSNPDNLSVNTSSSATWFKIVSSGDLTVNGSITAGNAAGNGSLVLLPNGNITLNGSLISNNPDGSIDGIFLQTPTYGVITQTKGTINTAGSVIVIDAGYGNIGSAAQPISVSGATPVINVNFATLGDAFISSPNELRAFNGIGNNIELSAINGVTIAGLTTVNNLSIRTTNGGNVVFDAGSLVLFAGGNASSCSVNVNGNATISTINNFTISANSLVLVSQNGDIGSSAQPIDTTASSISVSSLGKVFIDDTNSKVSLGAISAADFTLSGKNITATQPINVDGALTLIASSGNITYSGSTSNLVDLRSPNGTLTLPTAQLTATPDLTSGDGGTINVVAANIVYPGSATFTPLAVNAVGLGTGNGGSITFVLNSLKPVLVNNAIIGKNPPPTTVMALDARSGLAGGNGGTVSVSTGGNLTVEPAFLSASAAGGNGAKITLSAGKNLLINGPLNADAAGSGNGGSITLQSNSTTQFTIGATGTTNTNAILKSKTAPATPVLSVNGTTGNLNGSISVSNLGGNLTNMVPLTAVQTLNFTTGAAGSVLVKNALGGPSTAAISLSANGSGKVSSTTPKIQSSTLNLTATTGSIGSSTVPLQFIAGTISASAPGPAGVVNLTNQATGNITLGASGAGKSFKLTAPKATNISSAGTLSSATTIISAALGSVGQLASHFKIDTGASAGTATITAKGAVFADNLATAASTLNKSSGQSFTFAGAGNLTLKGISTTNGAIDVQTSSGLLQTAPSAVITTKNGSISLTNTDNTAAGSILFGKASRVTTNGPTGGLFPVNVTVGTGGTVSPVNPLPATIKVVTTTGGQALFSAAGTPGLSAVSPINTINLKGSDVTLNSGANGSIKLNGQVILTADPVPPPAAALRTSSALATAPASFASAESYTPDTLPDNPRSALQSQLQMPDVARITNTTQASFSWLGTQPVGNENLSSARTGFSDRTEGTTDPACANTEPRSEEIPLLFSGEASTDKLLRAYISNKEAKDAQHRYTLNRGAKLFAPSTNMEVDTAFGQVKIDAGSAVLVMAFPEGMAAYDLHDSHRNGVVVKAGGREIVLSPGRQAIISANSSKDLQHLNPIQSFAYRDVNEFVLGSGLKAISSEFSLGRALELLFSSNKTCNSQSNLQSAKTRKILASILKNAAILQQMHSTKGRFEQYTRPRSTAMAN